MSFNKEFYESETFTKLIFTDEVIKGIKFEECEFNACSFINCKFEKCKFNTIRFIDCTLSAIKPMNSQFSEISFHKCKAIGIDWPLAVRLEDLSFEDCQINYSNFKLMKIPKMKILNCEAKEVDFSETDLTKGDFKNTNFEKTLFFKTNLTDADFKNAKNYSIDTRTNILKKTRFSMPDVLGLLDGLDIIIE